MILRKAKNAQVLINEIYVCKHRMKLKSKDHYLTREEKKALKAYYRNKIKGLLIEIDEL